jgi:hypothetical protein
VGLAQGLSGGGVLRGCSIDKDASITIGEEGSALWLATTKRRTSRTLLPKASRASASPATPISKHVFFPSSRSGSAPIFSVAGVCTSFAALRLAMVPTRSGLLTRHVSSIRVWYSALSLDRLCRALQARYGTALQMPVDSLWIRCSRRQRLHAHAHAPKLHLRALGHAFRLAGFMA